MAAGLLGVTLQLLVAGTAGRLCLSAVELTGAEAVPAVVPPAERRPLTSGDGLLDAPTLRVTPLAVAAPLGAAVRVPEGTAAGERLGEASACAAMMGAVTWASRAEFGAAASISWLSPSEPKLSVPASVAVSSCRAIAIGSSKRWERFGAAAASCSAKRIWACNPSKSCRISSSSPQLELPS